MARLQDIIVGGVLVLTVTVLINTRPAEAGALEPEVCTDGGNECKNGGTCDTSTAPNECACIDSYMGDTCNDECSTNTDCDTDGTCGTISPKKCTCKDSTKEGPGCKKDKSGASAVTSFSLVSLCVILTGYLL